MNLPNLSRFFSQTLSYEFDKPIDTISKLALSYNYAPAKQSYEILNQARGRTADVLTVVLLKLEYEEMITKQKEIPFV